MIRMLFDCGNSRCKWAVADGIRILSRGVISGTGAEFTRHLRLAADDVPQPMEAAVVSVAGPDHVAAIETFCRQQWGLPLRQVVTPSRGGGIRVAYPEPHTLGTDRWAAMAGAATNGQLPAFVVDCGTAVTIDVVDASGDHEGGLIVPGLSAMRRSLSRGTHALPPVADGPMPLLASNTPDAIRAGTLRGLAAMIDGLYREVVASRDSDLQPLLTGGDADTLVAYMATPFTVMPDLVLHGLAAFLEKG
ncbi:type III pantothenate kinase [Arhodomonas sp. SL1]|uniref:type III pantothenate kinase n=1 Tax=Arhodomonas sp. SL1 TaxID=3425691 RepID=UPI003F880995